MDRRLPLPLGAELLDISVNHVTNPIEGQDQPASMTEPRQYKRLNEADTDIPAEGFHEQLCGLEDNFGGFTFEVQLLYGNRWLHGEQSMGTCYAHLDLEERQKLARWREAKLPMKEIALRLGRAPSTLYREMQRNRFVDDEIPELSGYYGMTAQRAYEKRRAIHRKLVRHPAMKAAVVDRLKAGWSPEQIAGRMKLEGHATSVSHETIYRYAYSRDGRSEALYRHLPEHRRRRRPRGTRRHHGRRFSNEHSISLRPVEVSERQQFGHWECDLVMFRKEFGKANITSLVERVSRFTVLAKNADRTSKPVMETLISGLKALPQPARRSITFDRGTEFTAWTHLKAGLGVAPWFCDPQSPWQKGTVENTNNRIRKYLPRKTDPTTITDRDLTSICDRLNATPRKCLGYRTPAEVFREKLMEAMQSGE